MSPQARRKRVVAEAIASGQLATKQSRSPEVNAASNGVRYASALQRLRDLGINVRQK